jgi:hypothetical protein
LAVLICSLERIGTGPASDNAIIVNVLSPEWKRPPVKARTDPLLPPSIWQFATIDACGIEVFQVVVLASQQPWRGCIGAAPSFFVAPLLVLGFGEQDTPGQWRDIGDDL